MDVVVSRYQGEKRISSLPYCSRERQRQLSRPARQLRMGARGSGRDDRRAERQFHAAAQPVRMRRSSVNYQDIGTNIDCWRSAGRGWRVRGDDQRLESSVYTNPDKRDADGRQMPVFRSYQSTNTLSC